MALHTSVLRRHRKRAELRSIVNLIGNHLHTCPSSPARTPAMMSVSSDKEGQDGEGNRCWQVQIQPRPCSSLVSPSTTRAPIPPRAVNQVIPTRTARRAWNASRHRTASGTCRAHRFADGLSDARHIDLRDQGACSSACSVHSFPNLPVATRGFNVGDASRERRRHRRTCT